MSDEKEEYKSNVVTHEDGIVIGTPIIRDGKYVSNNQVYDKTKEKPAGAQKTTVVRVVGGVAIDINSGKSVDQLEEEKKQK